MRNIYFSSILLWNKSLEEVMEIAHSYEYEGVEIWAQHFWFKNSSINSILNLKEKYGLKILCHGASNDINICSINEGIRKQSIKEIKKSILLSKRLEAEHITIHPGRKSFASSHFGWYKEVLLNSLNEITEFSFKNSVELSIELMEVIPKEFVTTPEIMNDIIMRLKHPIKTTLDIAHLEKEYLFELYLKQLKNINKIHISDRQGSKYHVTLGKGDLNCKAMIKEVIKLDLPLVIEGYDNSDNMQKFKENTDFIKSLL
ncbi:sugar phosphate isomerase/epimerase [Clostridium sp. DJ247]|uniref:sugar phosphate isomerase/epimerase family protein n=1 Tax=Clostridium sp. DJ247 TaxID=2726188 RepID=UPI001626E43C|nr:sugar phosphate isomerase/epimerase family protein [Clostridium sp. DJ247]MBC2578743.1 sugar phosphate isomerase/epimerase [Clostridium sp. DJ247]